MTVARSLRIDALRGFAACGIVTVNVWAFVYGADLRRFPTNEALGLADQLVVLLVSLLSEQKFYPVFAFLFGAGFALQTGSRSHAGLTRDAAAAAYRRRIGWLLVIGLLHGTLLWFGDILTTYALTAFWLAYKTRVRLRELVRSLRTLVIVNVIIFLVYGSIVVVYHAMLTEKDVADSIAKVAQMTQVYVHGSWGEVAAQRLANFGFNVMGLIVFGPRLALLFTLGALAVRLGWLTDPERHRAAWRKVLLIGLAIGVPLNILGAVSTLDSILHPYQQSAWSGVAMILVEIGGPALGAAFIAMFMLARERAFAWLAPLGKMTLTNYLMQSLIFMLLLQGFGLGLGAHATHVELLALCAVVLAAQWLWSVWWLRSHASGPMEQLWRRLAAK